MRNRGSWRCSERKKEFPCSKSDIKTKQSKTTLKYYSKPNILNLFNCMILSWLSISNKIRVLWNTVIKLCKILFTRILWIRFYQVFKRVYTSKLKKRWFVNSIYTLSIIDHKAWEQRFGETPSCICMIIHIFINIFIHIHKH